jgi:hypothetical protein
MRIFTSFLLILFLLPNSVVGQSYRYKKEKKTVQIIQPRQIYLNGGLRSNMGGKSRTYIQINLPRNTVKWYYSFTTSKGQSGNNELKLALQLSSIMLDPSSTTSSVLSLVKVPTGSSMVDVYLCNRLNIDAFLRKVDNSGGSYYYNMQGSTTNTKQAVVEIDNITSGIWYLGIKNPSSLNAVNVTIEVVAIVETR